MPFAWERPPIAGSPISVVLPVSHVPGSLTDVTGPLLSVLDNLSRDYEVILVSNGKEAIRDALPSEVWERGDQRLRCLLDDKSRGYGAALRTGLAAARFPLIFTMPADGGYHADDLPRMLALVDHVDIVVGCRRKRSPFKTALRSWLAFFAFGLRLADPACPVRLYRRNIFSRLPIQSTGRFADVEILAKANFLGCLLTEADVRWQPSQAPAGRAEPSTLSDFLRVFRRPNFGPVDAKIG